MNFEWITSPSFFKNGFAQTKKLCMKKLLQKSKTYNNNNNYTFILRTHLPKDTRGAQLLKNYYDNIYIQHHMKESFEINDNGN